MKRIRPAHHTKCGSSFTPFFCRRSRWPEFLRQRRLEWVARTAPGPADSLSLSSASPRSIQTDTTLRFLDSKVSDRDFTGEDEEPVQLRARGNSDGYGQADSHPERRGSSSLSRRTEEDHRVRARYASGRACCQRGGGDCRISSSPARCYPDGPSSSRYGWHRHSYRNSWGVS